MQIFLIEWVSMILLVDLNYFICLWKFKNDILILHLSFQIIFCKNPVLKISNHPDHWILFFMDAKSPELLNWLFQVLINVSVKKFVSHLSFIAINYKLLDFNDHLALPVFNYFKIWLEWFLSIPFFQVFVIKILVLIFSAEDLVWSFRFNPYELLLIWMIQDLT